MTNDLITISQAAALHRTSVAAILRMDSEGWVRMVRLKDHNEFFIRARDIQHVAELAKDEPRLLNCECIGGPCRCP